MVARNGDNAPMNTTIYPKGSGIKIRSVKNKTTIEGKTVSFGESFMVTVPARVTGRGRLRRQFGTKQEAEEWAGQQYDGTLKLGSEFFGLSEQERRDCVAAANLLRPLGMSVLKAASQIAEVQGKLAGRSLTEAVDFFCRMTPSTMTRKTTDEVYAELLAAKRADGLSTVYLQDLETRLRRFVDSFPGLVLDLTAKGISEWLRKLKCGPRARNNYRTTLRTFFVFAEACDFLPKGFVDFDKISKARELQTEIEIFTPQEYAKLLEAATLDPASLPPAVNRRYATGDMVVLLALGGLAGLRTAEIQRQLWEHIDLKRGLLRVSAVKGNTAARRLVPLCNGLVQWLEPWRRDSGPVYQIVKTPDAIRRLAERAGVSWKHNALRHSFISYRVAETQNVAQVSLEAGNTTRMIHQHYRELVTQEEAKAWFNIAPSRPANVIPQPKAVKQPESAAVAVG